MTIFCPECGTESPDGSIRCGGCGLDLEAELDGAGTPSRPTRWAVAAVAGASAVFTVVVSYLLGLSLVVQPQAYVRALDEQGAFETVRFILVEGSALLLLGPMSGFVLGALAAAIIFRGRHIREVALGATAGALAQILVWVIALGSDVGLLFTADLHMVFDGGGLRIRAFMLPIFFPTLFVFAALVTSVVTWIGLEQITNRGACLHCRKLHPVRPTPPPRCPSCQAPIGAVGVQWPWVMVGAAATGLAFLAVLQLTGQALGFYFHCDPFSPTDACREAAAVAREGGGWVMFRDVVDRQDAHMLLVQPWVYLAVVGALMIVAPALLGALLKRGARPSSGAVILVSWLAVTMVGQVVLATAGDFDGAFLWLLRMHVMGLFAWGITGFIGAMIGYSIRSRIEAKTSGERVSLTPSVEGRDSVFEASHRRHKLIMAAVTGAIVLVLGGGAAIWAALAPVPRCDRDDVDAFVSQPAIPASAVGRVCELPPSLDEHFRRMEASPPGLEPILAMRIATAEPELMASVCPEYAAALAETTAAHPVDKAEIFWQRCDLSEMGLSQSDIDGYNMHEIIMAMAVYGALQDSDPRDARRLVRAIVSR